MNASSGGVVRNQEVANRWGRVEAPPVAWLYQGRALGETPSSTALRDVDAGSKGQFYPRETGGLRTGKSQPSNRSIGQKTVSTAVTTPQERPTNLPGSAFRPIYD